MRQDREIYRLIINRISIFFGDGTSRSGQIQRDTAKRYVEARIFNEDVKHSEHEYSEHEVTS